MRVLHELAEAGFTIWPFEPAGDATIIEIYPRLFTGLCGDRSPIPRARLRSGLR
jgi:hypothetical protein